MQIKHAFIRKPPPALFWQMKSVSNNLQLKFCFSTSCFTQKVSVSSFQESAVVVQECCLVSEKPFGHVSLVCGFVGTIVFCHRKPPL